MANKYRVYIHYEGCWVEDVEAKSATDAEEDALCAFYGVPEDELIGNLGDIFVEGVEERYE